MSKSEVAVRGLDRSTDGPQKKPVLSLPALHFEGISVRTINRDGETWFVAADVCRCLGIVDTSNGVRGFDSDEKGTLTVRTPGGYQDTLIVSEPGLYRLIWQSRKPEAERFRRWVNHEVLPQIRRTGAYIGESATLGLQVPDTFAKILGETIGKELRPMGDKIDKIEGKVVTLSERVHNLDGTIQRFQRRRTIPSSVRSEAQRVAMRFYGGTCPCCQENKVLDAAGHRLDAFEMDHWYAVSRNRADETWPTCSRCNNKLANDPGFRRESKPAFENYQVKREKLTPRLFA